MIDRNFDVAIVVCSWDLHFGPLCYWRYFRGFKGILMGTRVPQSMDHQIAFYFFARSTVAESRRSLKYLEE